MASLIASTIAPMLFEQMANGINRRNRRKKVGRGWFKNPGEFLGQFATDPTRYDSKPNYGNGVQVKSFSDFLGLFTNKKDTSQQGNGIMGSMGKTMRKAGKNPIVQGMLFNTGMDLSGRLLNGVLNPQQQQGQGIKKCRKNFKLSHGLGVTPAPFGGMIPPRRPVMSVANRPTMNIATRPHMNIATKPSMPVANKPQLPITNRISTNKPQAPVHPSTSTALATRPANSISKLAPVSAVARPHLSSNKLANNSSMNTSHTSHPIWPSMRPPMSSKPSSFKKTLKSGFSKVKRLTKSVSSKVKRGVKSGIKNIRRKGPGVARQLAHPVHFSRKLARKAAVKSQYLHGKLSSKISKIKNPRIKKYASKASKLATRTINAVDRYGQRGNMGSRPNKLSKSIKKHAKKLHHAGRHFITSAKSKIKGTGAPFVPGPLS